MKKIKEKSYALDQAIINICLSKKIFLMFLVGALCSNEQIVIENQYQNIKNSLNQEIEPLLIIDINASDRRGMTLLQYALSENDNEVVQWLLEQGADVNMLRNDNRPHVYTALLFGDIEQAELLYRYGARINLLLGGRSLLEVSVNSNLMPAVRWLLGKPESVLRVRTDKIENAHDDMRHFLRQNRVMILGLEQDVLDDDQEMGY